MGLGFRASLSSGREHWCCGGVQSDNRDDRDASQGFYSLEGPSTQELDSCGFGTSKCSTSFGVVYDCQVFGWTPCSRTPILP